MFTSTIFQCKLSIKCLSPLRSWFNTKAKLLKRLLFLVSLFYFVLECGRLTALQFQVKDKGAQPYIRMSPSPSDSLPSRLPHDADQSCLCCTAGPGCLSILFFEKALFFFFFYKWLIPSSMYQHLKATLPLYLLIQPLITQRLPLQLPLAGGNSRTYWSEFIFLLHVRVPGL